MTQLTCPNIRLPMLPSANLSNRDCAPYLSSPICPEYLEVVTWKSGPYGCQHELIKHVSKR